MVSLELVSCYPSLAFLVVASLVIGWLVYKQVQFHVWRYPPGPLGLPLLGYYPRFVMEPNKTCHELSKKYGPLFSLPLGFPVPHTIIVTDYEWAKELLCHSALLSRPPSFFDFAPGKGGFAGMSGHSWQEQRRFSLQTMRSLGHGKGRWEGIIQEDVTEFVEYLQNLEGKATDVIGPLMRSLASNNTALLTSQRFTEKENNPDVKTLEKSSHVFNEYLQLTNLALGRPWLLKYLVKFNIAGCAEKMMVMEDLDDIFRREIEKRRKKGSADSTDFIGCYLEALNNNNIKNTNFSYSVENLVGNMTALFFGGSDTTIASLHWLIVLMAAYPEVQKKVQEELDDVVGPEVQVKWDDRKQLPYTMATIFEMERWAVIAPFYIPRWASETVEFRGYVIPRGSTILGCCWMMHRDPRYWDNPDQFAPERFIDIPGNRLKDASKMPGYAAFSFGKRNCPGEAIAIMTLFLYFTSLMQKFTIQAPPGRRGNVDTYHFGVVNPTSQELCFIER